MDKEKKIKKVKVYLDPIPVANAYFVKKESWKDSNGLEQFRQVYMFQIEGKWKQGAGTVVTLDDGSKFLCCEDWEDVE